MGRNKLGGFDPATQLRGQAKILHCLGRRRAYRHAENGSNHM